MVLVHHTAWDPSVVDRAWLWPLRRALQALPRSAGWPTREALDQAYSVCTGHLAPPEPLRFVENVRKADRRQGDRVDPEALYDGRIAVRREVPTRERDWHDLFNALCFATFPRAKLALHRRQYAILHRRLAETPHALPARRTREQDTLTLFDEGGIVIAADASTCEEIHSLPDERRTARLRELESEGRARTLVFGHALFEHYLEGLTHTRGGARLLMLESLPREEARLLDCVDGALACELSRPEAFQSPTEHLRLEGWQAP